MYIVFPRLSATFGETINIGGKRGWRMIENKKIITPTPRYLYLNLALDSKATEDRVCLTIHVTHSFLVIN